MIRILILIAMVLAGSADGARPKLINLIVIDQFPAFYLDRFNDLFGPDGFHRMELEGVWYRNAYFSYGQTLTGPGHATIATGRNPSRHGIVLNNWWDRHSRRIVNCVEDSTVRPVGCAAGTGRSPALLRQSSFGDEIRAATAGRAKVWGLSLKDRSAILLGGRQPNGAIWFDDHEGCFLTSTHYAQTLPAWVQEFNEADCAEKYFKTRWDRVLPDSAYLHCTMDDATWESGDDAGFTNILPKIIGEFSPEPDRAYYEALAASPFGNDLLFDLARHCVESESLGADDDCDVLCISLSSNDEAGHLYGPDSHEMLDFTVRTDRQLADWIRYLDQHIGLEHCLIALTSDHGVCRCPEALRQTQPDAQGGRYDSKEIANAVNAKLTADLAAGPDTIAYIEKLLLPWAYLNDSLIRHTDLRLDHLVANALSERDEVDTALTFLSQDAGECPDSMCSLIREGYMADRSGDVYVHLKPNWLPNSICTTHGSAHPYDRHVPVLYLGCGLQPQVLDRRIDLRDIAPTLCAKAGLRPPQSMDGRVLAEVVK